MPTSTLAVVAASALWAAAQTADIPGPPGLDQIASPDAGVRQQAWHRVLADTDRARLGALLPRINEALAGAGEEAFAEAAERLRDQGLWGWAHQPPPLILREIEAAALSADDGRHGLAARALQSCPLELEAADVLPLVDLLLLSGAPEVRRSALEAACLWAGRTRATALAALTIFDEALERDRLLAWSWSLPAPAPASELPGVWPDDDADIVEAALVARLRLDPDGAAVLARTRESWQTEPRPAFEALDVMAASPARTETAALAADPAAPIWLRRLAAWQLAEVSPEVLQQLLDGPAAAEDGHVYALALLAERFLTREAAVAAAASWIRSFDDDRKRCGALLAMLAGAERRLLEEACAAEDVPAVKRLERLALAAMAAGESDDPTARDLGARCLMRPDGDFDPDVALAILGGGHDATLAVLTSQPRGDGWDAYCRSVQARSWLVERLVPGWHAAAGRPLVAEPRAVRLHFDDLRALRLLTQRRLTFDRASLRFN